MKGLTLTLACFFLLSTPGILNAQSSESKPINKHYAALDLKGIRAFAPLRAPESYGFDLFRKKFEQIPAYSSWSDETNLGFGARRIKLFKGLGSVTAYVDFLIFRNKIAYYELGLEIKGSQMPESELIEHWTISGGLALEPKENNLVRVMNFDRVWSDYKKSIADALGPMKEVALDGTVAPAYKLLVDPLKNSRISVVACDDGKPAIDRLENAKRIDLIENVLRGYNPGGRIYAAISLLRMKRAGKKLNTSTINSITKVIKLDANAETCWGHIVTAGLKARDIVPEYVDSEDW